MKDLMFLWKMDPSYADDEERARKLKDVRGARSQKTSTFISPREVWIVADISSLAITEKREGLGQGVWTRGGGGVGTGM